MSPEVFPLLILQYRNVNDLVSWIDNDWVMTIGYRNISTGNTQACGTSTER